MLKICNDILIVADFPPPLQGNSIVTFWVKQTLDTNENKPFEINTSVNGKRFYKWRRIAKFAKACKFVAIANRNSTIYVALSHGASLILQITLINLSKFRGFRTIVHHHTYYPITRPNSFLNIMCHYSLKKGVEHVFLSESMKEKYLNIWKPLGKCWVITNHQVAASRIKEEISNKSELGSGLCFAGRLSEEKGFWEASIVIEELLSRYPEMYADFLGPVEQKEIERELLRLKNIFLNRINICFSYDELTLTKVLQNSTFFLFPSKYFNEASPLIVLEAQAAGNICLTSDIGSLKKDVISPGNASNIESWIAESINTIENLKVDKVRLLQESNKIREKSKDLSKKSEIQLKEVFFCVEN